MPSVPCRPATSSAGRGSRRGGALDSAGKRAAFALFYAPLHFLVTRKSCERFQVRSMACGKCRTSAAGPDPPVRPGRWSRVLRRSGDSMRVRWAVAEARWTYSQLGLAGRAAARDVSRATLSAGEGTATVVAYVRNELADPARTQLFQRLLTIGLGGDRVLLIEPIARRAMPWWPEWERAFVRKAAGRMSGVSPRRCRSGRPRSPVQRASRSPRELAARSLYLPPTRPSGG